MNFIKKYFGIALAMLLALSAHAKVVEFIEDTGALQAPENILELVAQAAQTADFKSDYEVAVPKKQAIQMNPWNKFVSFGIHPYTKNPFIVVNPSWFLTLPADQQRYLLVRSFVILEKGIVPLSTKMVSPLLILLTIALGMLLFWALGRTALVHQAQWVRLLIVCAIMFIGDITVTSIVQTRLTRYLSERYDRTINEIAVQKTGDRQAAIKALETWDAFIKAELSKGEVFWKPYESLFEKYAKGLQQ